MFSAVMKKRKKKKKKRRRRRAKKVVIESTPHIRPTDHHYRWSINRTLTRILDSTRKWQAIHQLLQKKILTMLMVVGILYIPLMTYHTLTTTTTNTRNPVRCNFQYLFLLLFLTRVTFNRHPLKKPQPQPELLVKRKETFCTKQLQQLSLKRGSASTRRGNYYLEIATTTPITETRYQSRSRIRPAP